MTETLDLNCRIKFPRGKQRYFLENIFVRYNLNRRRLAHIFDINIRTLSDWFCEKNTMGLRSLSNLLTKYTIDFPEEAKIIKRFWYVRKGGRIGGLNRYKLYGNPGTPAGRRKGGLISISKFIDNHQFGMKVGMKMRVPIKYPRKSSELAEFIGVVLGDGSLTNYQLRITLSSNTDKEYSFFIRDLIKHLFGLNSKIILSKNGAYFDIVVYSRNLAEFLVSLGLAKGNKVKNRADIPSWIKQKRLTSIRCLRGLMDTDGSFYRYNHKVGKFIYQDYAICFTNRSSNLVHSVYTIFKKEQFHPVASLERVYLYKKKDIVKYFRIIGSSNPWRIRKYKEARIC